MEHINRILACFYGDYREYIKKIGNLNEEKVELHLNKFGYRYIIITENVSTPQKNLIKFSVRRKKGLKKYIFSKIYDATDFI